MKKLLIINLAILTVLASASLVARNSIAAGNFTVSNTNDSGSGSLRQAIIDANNAGGGTIDATGGYHAEQRNSHGALAPRPEERD